MLEPKTCKSGVGVEITSDIGGRTERRLAVMTPQTVADLARILEANGKRDKPQSLGYWLADKIAADIKMLDTTHDENDAFHRAAVEKLS